VDLRALRRLASICFWLVMASNPLSVGGLRGHSSGTQRHRRQERQPALRQAWAKGACGHRLAEHPDYSATAREVKSVSTISRSDGIAIHKIVCSRAKERPSAPLDRTHKPLACGERGFDKAAPCRHAGSRDRSHKPLACGERTSRQGSALSLRLLAPPQVTFVASPVLQTCRIFLSARMFMLQYG